jgi:hypothetical protein
VLSGFDKFTAVEVFPLQKLIINGYNKWLSGILLESDNNGQAESVPLRTEIVLLNYPGISINKRNESWLFISGLML